MARPVKRCWNCRWRKKRCDRKRPGCDECSRRGELCAGYGTLLSWPREADTSRAVVRAPGTQLPIRNWPLFFVNVTVNDVRLLNQMQTHGWSYTNRDFLARAALGPGFIQPRAVDRPVSDRFLALQGRDDMEVVMAAFSDGIDELHHVLIRMTASSTTSATLALRYSLMTLSFQRLGVYQKAAQYQIYAIRALQATIEQPLPWNETDAFRAVAASLVLYIYEMENAESSMSWVIYFNGAKRIADTVYTAGENYDGDPELLMDWIFSHCTMYQFSVFHWTRQDYPQEWLAKQRRMVSKSVLSPMRQIILPLYGCSLELLDTLHDLLQNCLDREDSEYMSNRHKGTLKRLTQVLNQLIQRESMADDINDGLHASHARQIGESYRLAALLYLERVARHSPRDAPRVVQLRSDAFTLLGSMKVCDRPWPLFVLSMEAENEDQRRTAMSMIEHMVEYGSDLKFVAIHHMVREGWVLQDLSIANDLDALKLYRAVIQSNQQPPSFV